MIRIASQAAKSEDAATWPTNKAPSKRKRARQSAERGTSRTSSQDGAQAVKAKGKAKGQGKRKVEILPAPTILIPHGTIDKGETLASEAFRRSDPTALAVSYALQSLLVEAVGMANGVANNRVANSVANAHVANSVANTGEAAVALPCPPNGGGGERLTNSQGAKIARKASSGATRPSRAAYMRELMRVRRAATKLATVIL